MFATQHFAPSIFKPIVLVILLVLTAGLSVEVAISGVVTNTADSGAGSLREVIDSAASGDTITFATNLSGGAIMLTGGQILLSNNVTIDASSLPGGIQITAPGSRAFYVNSTASVTLNALTITGCNDQTRLGGGGIFNTGFLNLNKCTVSGNSSPNALANAGGGGIFNSNVLIITQSTISGNRSDDDNTANSGGGGIYNGNALLNVNQSTITDNHADGGTLGGGGIYNGNGSQMIFNSIVSGNSAMSGSGADIYTSNNITLSGANIIQSLRGNYTGPAPIDAAPMLAILGNYGGPTQTCPPLGSSIAINTASNTRSYTNDQRGAPMVSQGVSDIGSVELDPPTVVTEFATYAVNSNATLNATVNPNTLPTSAWFQWGITNNAYANQTTPVALGSSNAVLAFTNNLSNLTAGVVYHCRVIGSNLDGLGYGSDVQFGSAPIVTLFGAASVTNECHTIFTDPGATNSAGLPVTVSGVVNTNSPSVYQLTYSATNSLGLTGSVIRTVYVVDTTPPVITILGSNPVTIPINSAFPDPGAAALDACGGAFVVTTNSNVNPAVAGNYTITYSSTDSYGNTGTAVRTVIIRNSSIFVTNTNDMGVGSLRQAINTASAGDYIQFATNLSGATLLLSNGPLNITTNITIDASALPGGIQINGRRGFIILTIDSNCLVELTGLTITNGFTYLQGGAGIINSGTLTLNECSIGGNLAVTNNGGGIFNSGNLNANQTVFIGNQAEGNNCYGGAIFNAYTGTLTLNQCTLSGNSASNGIGGGIGNIFGTVTVNQCTFTGNSANNAGSGGGIGNNGGLVTVNECTFTGNSADTNGGGGAIFSLTYGSANGMPLALYVNQSTLTGNHADFGSNAAGGAIFSTYAYISNSVVAGNTATNGSGADIYGYGGIYFYGANIIEDISGSFLGTFINADPHLAPLGNYGGPTLTCPPLPGSPAIDACASSLFTTDQRGFPRIIGAYPDIGAVEGAYSTNGPGELTGVTHLASGAVEFGFTNITDVSFSVLASTNILQPLATWTNLGIVGESPLGSGQFHFTDLQATNFPQRFYRVRSP